MNEQSKAQIEKRVKFLRQVVNERYLFEFPYGCVLEALATVFSFDDWNTASALTYEKPSVIKLETHSESKPGYELSFASNLQTEGECAELFANFDRNK